MSERSFQVQVLTTSSNRQARPSDPPVRLSDRKIATVFKPNSEKIIREFRRAGPSSASSLRTTLRMTALLYVAVILEAARRSSRDILVTTPNLFWTGSPVRRGEVPC